MSRLPEALETVGLADFAKRMRTASTTDLALNTTDAIVFADEAERSFWDRCASLHGTMDADLKLRMRRERSSDIGHTKADIHSMAMKAREQGWSDAAYMLRQQGQVEAAERLERTQDERAVAGNDAAAIFTKKRGNTGVPAVVEPA